MDCQVCCEKYNKSTRKDLKCQYCDYHSCRGCTEKYLLDSIDPCCMSCKKIWSTEFIESQFTKVFINTTFKTHREGLLLNQQKSMLPQTQNNVIAEKNVRSLKKDVFRINTNIHLLQTQIIGLERDIMDKNQQIIENERLKNQVVADTKTKNKFIRKCPMEDCKGFLSSKWKCGLCETYICNKCNEPKPDDHECIPDNITTMELLNKDTKPCPNCGTMISKIQGGCDQMFCVDCHTAFSWNKGTIERGIIHNPHYYEWQRSITSGEIPRNAGEYCDNQPFPRYNNILNVLYANSINKESVNYISCVHNVCTHMQYGINNGNHINFDQLLLNLRIEYLMDELTETVWKKKISVINKRKEKVRDFQNINTMFINVVGDYLNTIINNNNTNFYKLVLDTLNGLENLRKYYNESIEVIGKRYSCVYPYIDPKFVYHQNAKTAKNPGKRVN